MRNLCYPKYVRETYGNTYIPDPYLCAPPGIDGHHCPDGETCLDRYPGNYHDKNESSH